MLKLKKRRTSLFADWELVCVDKQPRKRSNDPHKRRKYATFACPVEGCDQHVQVAYENRTSLLSVAAKRHMKRWHPRLLASMCEKPALDSSPERALPAEEPSTASKQRKSVKRAVGKGELSFKKKKKKVRKERVRSEPALHITLPLPETKRQRHVVEA